MANPLVPCSGCGRHVRASESQCPFCGVTLAGDLASRAVPSTTQRLGRGAMFVFATTVALGACAPSPGPSDGATPSDSAADTGTAQDSGGPMPLYGAPVPSDGGPTERDSGPSPTDSGGPIAMYGGPPPVDAGPGPDSGGPSPVDAGSPLDDGGGVAPLYGGPFPDDAGREAGPGLRYGAPPPSGDV
jgi:hypothetical protein